MTISIWHAIAVGIGFVTIFAAAKVGKTHGDYDFISPIAGLVTVLFGAFLIAVAYAIKGCVE